MLVSWVDSGYCVYYCLTVYCILVCSEKNTITVRLKRHLVCHLLDIARPGSDSVCPGEAISPGQAAAEVVRS
eukprot:10282323-Heterocapsa_arctica.AAC.1